MHERAEHVLAGGPRSEGKPWREILAARGIDV